MKEQIKKVKDFHIATDVPCYEHPILPSMERIELRNKLIKEETQELVDACERGDLVAIADGLADVLYIAFGTAHEFGLANCLPDCFAEVHRSNMTKLDPVTGKAIKREDGKVLKPATYSPANLLTILKAACKG